MNNHWHTNYRAEQEGPTVFRFALRAHKAFAPLDAAKFGLECSQPLIVVPVSREALAAPPFKLSSDKVIITAFKPSDDGRGWIVRLFGASGQTERVPLTWPGRRGQKLWLSDTSEQPGQPLGRSVVVPPWGVVTLRAESN